jgi:hypothetical protein
MISLMRSYNGLGDIFFRGPMLDKDRHQWPQDIDFWWALGVCNWQATQAGLACNPLGISGAAQSGCCEWMKKEAA